MISLRSARREMAFMVRDRAAMLWLLIAIAASSLAVSNGLAEVSSQRQAIGTLVELDRADRETALAEQSDWGGAAYYSFHLTWNPPSDFAFASLGQRDSTPWAHRVRMLALEGQLHEADTANPEFGLVGRFDFSFVAAFIAPVLVILLLHDLLSSERGQGRYELLSATAADPRALWLTRGAVRWACLTFCLLMPLWAGGVLEGTGWLTLLAASAVVTAYLAFWALIAGWAARRKAEGPVIASGLLVAWACFALILPAAVRVAVEQAVPLPDGAEIILTQREAVNEAWDLPKSATMEAFLERHPEWTAYSEISRPFEWKWYYAFQQVGDERAERLSQAYRDGRARRDAMAGWVAILAPPSLVDRALNALARTDTRADLAYEAAIRDFHRDLRQFYYPRLFRDAPFERRELENLPEFSPWREQG
jgi:ABC-2 type transport system permease protein